MRVSVDSRYLHTIADMMERYERLLESVSRGNPLGTLQTVRNAVGEERERLGHVRAAMRVALEGPVTVNLPEDDRGICRCNQGNVILSCFEHDRMFRFSEREELA